MPQHDPPSPDQNPEPDEDPADGLTDEAMAALDRGDLDEARRLSAQLREMRYSSCFEIEALVLIEEDEVDRAIEVLREGVAAAPDVWALWQLLGNCLSDSDEFDEALACYERGLGQENADRASLLFNRATALSRTDKDDEALQVLEQVLGALEADAIEWGERPGLRGRAWALRLQLLVELERCAQVKSEARDLKAWLDEVAEREQDEEPSSWQGEQQSLAWSLSARALADCGEQDEAREWAATALDIDRCNEDALDLLRDLSPDAPLATRCFMVTLEGEWPYEEDDEGEFGFLTSLEVVAREADEAVRLAMELEGDRWEEPLQVDECKDGGECDEQPVGVYRVHPYHVFPLHAEDEEDEELAP